MKKILLILLISCQKEVIKPTEQPQPKTYIVFVSCVRNTSLDIIKNDTLTNVIFANGGVWEIKAKEKDTIIFKCEYRTPKQMTINIKFGDYVYDSTLVKHNFKLCL